MTNLQLIKKKTHAVFLSVLHVEPKASASVPVPGVTPVAMKRLRYQLIIRAYKLRGKTRLARDPQFPTLAVSFLQSKPDDTPAAYCAV